MTDYELAKAAAGIYCTDPNVDIMNRFIRKLPELRALFAQPSPAAGLDGSGDSRPLLTLPWRMWRCGDEPSNRD